MTEISTQKFDEIVHHSVRINLTDGTVLTYDLTPTQKEELWDDLSKRSSNNESDKPHSEFLLFEAYPNRVVLINTKYMLRLVVRYDSKAFISGLKYLDNFNILDEDQKSEDDFAIEPEGEGEEMEIPQVIIKLSNMVDYPDPGDVLTFSSLNGGELSFLDMEIWDTDFYVREFIELIDDDGETNFIPMKQIVCLEADSKIIFEFGLEEGDDEML